jgi:UDP-glucose 4-epimerase
MTAPTPDSPTALVTGAAGFIGSHLVEALLENGWTVRALDDLSGGKPENLDRARALAAPGRLEFRRGDVRDFRLVSSLVSGAETVFHLAGMVSAPQSQLEPELCLDVNGRGTLNVMRAAAAAEIGRLVYASSSAVYGDLPAPQSEDQSPKPNTPYAAMKLLGENLGLFYRESSPLITVSLRFFNVYGPRQSPDGPDSGVIPIFAQALKESRSPVIFGDGAQTRDFVHVDDAVRAALLASRATDPGDGVFNVATGRGTTVAELADLMRRLAPGAPEPIFAPPRPGDPVHSAGRPDKAAEKLGFSASTTLSEGLSDLLRSAEAGGSWTSS